MIKTPFNDYNLRLELLKRINQIEGVKLSVDRLGGRPDFPLIALKDPQSMKQFIETLDWVVTKIKESE